MGKYAIAQDTTDPKLQPGHQAAAVGSDAEPQIEMAGQWRLMWWKFRKHKLALFGLALVLFFYFMALFADFFAPVQPGSYRADYVYAPPQQIHLLRDGRFAPYVYAYTSERDPQSFQKIWAVDAETVIPIGLFVRGEPYRLWGLIEMDVHLIGPLDGESPFYLLGADSMGRDVLSRMIHSSRISLSIGLVGVALSMSLGIVLGGISGLVGGLVDDVIQRLIEVLMTIPDLPLLISLAAMVPLDMPVVQVYFLITLIIALRSWTGMARVVRSKFLSVREEDYVLAAQLDGAVGMRLILRHMLPSFYSHIIASLTLAIPGMILAETALSFLGLGLRPPAVSWGVMLQDSQKIAVISSYPWLLSPAFLVIIVVLAFNFLGDGLRDAADPYSS